jgi:succinate dehydrogenase / fumarate reductase flavoprotein subunit
MIEGYPESMWESIEKVHQTREQRLKETFKRMPMGESDELLRKFHPDYKLGQKRVVKVGPSKGMSMSHEVANLLEAHPLVDPSEVDLSRIDYDVDLLIIGGGGAGTVASLWASYNGIKPADMLIVTKLRHGDSNSMMAQGGTQAADRADDSPLLHYLDTIGGGHFTNKPELVKALVMDAPLILKWHEELGIIYDRDEEGNFMELSGGGASRFRLHCAKDYTGMEQMRVIRDDARNLGVPVLEFSPVIELLKDTKGQVAGAILSNLETKEYLVVRAKATVLATGGFGRLHIQNYQTTNHYGATADGLVLAYRAGARLIDMDSVQYHPTGAAYPLQIAGLLITEKVRGAGAVPVNKDGELFVHPLEPRDVEASAFIRECYERNKGVRTLKGRGVWLDSPMVEAKRGEGTIEKNFPAMHRMFKRFGIDMTKQPLLVFPTLHYQNGGVEIDEHTQTSIPCLFACGEVAGGIHGKNRLMGNSTLDYNVFGRRAGINAAKRIKAIKLGKLTLDHVIKYEKALAEAGIKTERKAPMILPEYRGKEALERYLDIGI